MANRAELIRQENSGLPVSRRGRNFIEFDLGGGKKRHVATIEPLHVRNSETEIDSSFVADTGAWQWRMAQADFQVHARDIFNVGNIIEWRHSSGEWIIVDPQSINWVNQDYSREQIAIKQPVVGVVDDCKLSFPAGYGAGRHFEYIAHPKRLIKHITIDSATDLPAPTVTGTIHFEAEWTLSTSSGVDLWLDGAKWTKENGVRVKTAHRIEFRNTANTEVLWYADAPIAHDSSTPQKTVSCEYEVRRSGGPTALFITVRVPKTWIDTATFPIVVDPTFTDGYGGDVQTYNDTFIDGQDAYESDNFGTHVNIGAGELNVNNEVVRTLIKFAIDDTDNIPAGSTIDSATLYVYITADWATNARTHRVYRMKTAWVENQATWLIKSTGNNWTAEGGFDVADCEQTDIGSTAFLASESMGQEKTFSLTASKIQEMISGGSFTNNGFLIKVDTEDNDYHGYGSSDHATTGYRPKLVVEYTEVTESASASASLSPSASPSLSPSPSESPSASLSPSASASPSLSPSASESPSLSPSASESPSLSPSASPSASASPSPSPGITATVCWGHVTGVTEDNTRTFTGNWTGTGSIEGAGDLEKLVLFAGQYMISEMVDTGVADIELDQNFYRAGDDVLLQYRHGATPNACVLAAWNNYVGSFTSLGYVQIRAESTL